MANVRTFIWHDGDGKIVAVGHPVEGAERGIQPAALDDGGVIEESLEEELLPTLHTTHRVDVEAGRVRPDDDQRS